ncbi:DUF2281 domain-containing protein [Algoriphagus sp. A40]|uniref:DUF2281 domain-containing protein n=1 Tax=Algoriphagus sp. A40 TaxID=1945863 RepID=UPI000986DEF9|nr:DUF2281 domain-containing protein [Algoriphagus sp. A40]OOG70466.1 hypothetical protein B0E43_17825 [Algoriphagus sp. A40]
MSDFEIILKFQSLPEEMKKKVLKFMESLQPTFKSPPKKRKAGLASGKIKIKPGFDDPIADFADYS